MRSMQRWKMYNELLKQLQKLDETGETKRLKPEDLVSHEAPEQKKKKKQLSAEEYDNLFYPDKIKYDIEQEEEAFKEEQEMYREEEELRKMKEAKLSGKYRCKGCDKPISKWDFDKNRQTCWDCNDAGDSQANQADKFFKEVDKEKKKGRDI